MSEVHAPVVTVVAKASRDYRWRRYALVLVMVGYAAWSAYDGYVHMPDVNRQDKLEHPGIEILRYPDLDIKLNKAFAWALPPMAMAFLGWVLYASRGAYRFDGTTISAPGHEKVSLKSLRKIDASKWDRKGIAYLQYQMPGSAKLGVIKLDDFIYQRKPTDEIFRQITLAMESNKPAAVNAALQRITCSFCNAQNLPSATNCSGCGAPLDVKDLVGNG